MTEPPKRKGELWDIYKLDVVVSDKSPYVRDDHEWFTNQKRKI